MIPPIGNLLLAFVAVVGAFLYPKLPTGAPFSSDQFVQILQYILISIVGWNIKAVAQKSSLPTLSQFLSRNGKED